MLVSRGMSKRLLVVMPTMWDFKQFAACRGDWSGRFTVKFAEPSDADCSAHLDALAYIAETATAGGFDGVFSSSDYPGASIAAAIAYESKLIGPDPELILEASHKLTSRHKQQACVPDATPRFCLVNPDNLEPPLMGFPCFVKPIKGAFSMFARRVDSMEDLAAHLQRPQVREFRLEFLGIFNALWRHYAGTDVDGGYFIAEELLTGQQVTVEGFVFDGDATVVGVVDSEFHPGTTSFARFVYPSALPSSIQERMADVAIRCIRGMGLRRCFFNIEMIWDGAERVSIIEVNPRICGQFGDLYAKVDGRNAYAVVPELKCGNTVDWPRGEGYFKYAASVPLRLFSPVVVAQAPDAELIAELEDQYPGTLIWNEIQAGQACESFVFEDGASFRYCVINLGADSREELASKAARITAALGYRFRALQ
jgi:biotin carboxylase